ncbi:MAG: tryptophan synthase subunit alpha [Psychroflexus halocasei]|uniref:tryptophan synthase subunit alpha n=1 Tax=Psychroflexus sp. S27 TaxID=1982757 RepID=UPI000C29911E|nr:tryptophan synthase subunit alpha [Psychroflexus sp. S27]PJX23705.1 tryptophan synthase subunit alpha [Psychroflexus sp. S27]
MNKLKTVLNQNHKKLSIYFTAGFPELDDTTAIIKALEASHVDFIEVGLPYSDPLADGPTIQKSSKKALENGFTTQLLFDQLNQIKDQCDVPLILMGYFNVILQFGVEKFCSQCENIGIEAVIIPDLPLEIYKKDYRKIFDSYGIHPIFLITPQSSEKRIRQIDEISQSFIYMVSSASTTGGTKGFGNQDLQYFDRISKMQLKSKLITGFGIKDAETFEQGAAKSDGCIIGSAYINFLKENKINQTAEFINQIRNY